MKDDDDVFSPTSAEKTHFTTLGLFALVSLALHNDSFAYVNIQFNDLNYIKSS